MSYTFLDFAYDVLLNQSKPLTYQEIWETGTSLGFDKELNTSGKTPWDTLGARLFVSIRDNPKSQFIKVGNRPARFFLKSKQNLITPDIIEKIEISEIKDQPKYNEFTERDLHPVLSYYAYTNPSFNRGKNILTKTIFHEKSKKQGYSEWSHPDLIGFYLPIEDWSPDLLEFNRITNNNALKLYSFELKKSITKANYRESFFQAVSNSSWAHEGYLVTAEIKQDDDLLSELERLSNSFGIGIIKLDLKDIDASYVLYHAKSRVELDWDTMNKLSEQNQDFSKFLKDVKNDFNIKEISKDKYDRIPDDIEGYLSKNILHNLIKQS